MPALLPNPKTVISLFLVFIVSFSLSAQRKKGQDKTGKEKPGKQQRVTLSGCNVITGSPTANAVTVSVILQNGGECFIEYSTEAGRFNHQTGLFYPKQNEPYEITIPGLQPNTTYYYRLNYKESAATAFTQTATAWFATQKNKSSSFSFAVQGDSHPERQGKMFNPELYRTTIQQVSQLQPDFYIMMGDDFSIDRLLQQGTVTKETVDAVYKTQRSYLGNMGNNPPLFLVNGNHEQAAKYAITGSPDDAAVLAAVARKTFFPLPSPGNFYSGDRDTVKHIGLLKDYYAFEWGNALFVVIDPYWHSDVPVDNLPAGEKEAKTKRDPWGATLGIEQYQWLKHTLENSKATFRFVFAHHVNGTGRGAVERAKYFEWGGYGQNGQWLFDKYRPGWEMPIHQLFVKNKVTIFFQGHDHLFARQELDGVIYQSVPNPADDSYTAFNRDAYTSGDVLPNSGLLQVLVSKNEVTVKYNRSFLGDKTQLPAEVTKGFEYTIKKQAGKN